VTLPHPEFRRRVRDLAESQWRAPVDMVFLNEVKPEFEVPGRRKDGTVKGARLVRRFFWNLLRGTVGGVVSVVLSVAGGGIVHAFGRKGRVTGPANAQALGMVDAARPARGPWLVHTDSRVGVIDSGSTFTDPADAEPPVFLWQGAGPRVDAKKRRITWPDGSEFQYDVSGEEAEYLRQPDAR
jgi:hypothetical protein